MALLEVQHIRLEAPDTPHKGAEHPQLPEGLTHSRFVEGLKV
jgi:hypothetical protein